MYCSGKASRLQPATDVITSDCVSQLFLLPKCCNDAGINGSEALKIYVCDGVLLADTVAAVLALESGFQRKIIAVVDDIGRCC